MSVRPTKRPKGLRRVERWAVGVVMAVVAIVLERIVLRSVKRGGREVAVEPEATTLTSKGGEVDFPG
ncbi:MAG: hypothetical protein ACM3OO_08245 [Planctomycetaceae bacterium]